MKQLHYLVLKSTPEDWDTLYSGSEKEKAYSIAKENSFDFDVMIETFEMEYYEYEKGIGEMKPKDERLKLEQVYKGTIETI